MKKDTGDVELKGELNTAASGDADMKAYVYGSIVSASIYSFGSSSGFSMEHIDTGIYRITFTVPISTNYLVMATIVNSPNVPAPHAPRLINYVPDFGEFTVYINDLSGNLSNSDFSFVVYKK